jgi:hypothetical protein
LLCRFLTHVCILFILLFDDVLMHHIWNFREHQLIWKNAYGKTTEAKDPWVEKFEIFAWDSFHQNNNFFSMTHFRNLNTIQIGFSLSTACYCTLQFFFKNSFVGLKTGVSLTSQYVAWFHYLKKKNLRTKQ